MSVSTIAVVVLALGLMVALVCERRPARGMLLAASTWFAALVVSELAAPLAAAYVALAAGLAVAGAAKDPAGVVALSVLAVGVLRLAALAAAQRATADDLQRALASLRPDVLPTRMPRVYRWLPGLMLLRLGVRHQRRVVHTRRRRWRLRLDIYRPSRAPRAAERRPAIIHVHGGGWIAGSRHEQGILLLNHLAAHGWVGFNVDYRLSPWARWPAQIVDVKAAIAWVREHAAQYGVDPSFIAISGGSAGGHLCALAALTAGDSAFQPGFESADTSVQAAVSLYGIYDLTDGDGALSPWMVRHIVEGLMFRARRQQDLERFRQASPLYRVHPEAPPFLVLHGARDSLVNVAEARRFVRRLGQVSRSEVRYAELRDAQHGFDLLPSLRSALAIEAIERFLATMLARHRAGDSGLARGASAHGRPDPYRRVWAGERRG